MNSKSGVGHRTLVGHPTIGPEAGSGANSAAPPIPWGSPLVWYDTDDLDLQGNRTLTVNGPVATAVNKGSLGTSWNATQGTVSRQPLLHAPSRAGFMNNRPSLSFNALFSMFLQTGINAALPSANLIVVTGFKASNLANLYAFFDGQTGGRSGMSVAAGTGGPATGVLSMLGTGAAATTKGITAGSYHVAVCTYNGANSVLTLDGSDSAVVNPTNQAMTGVTLGSIAAAPTFSAPYDQFDFFVYLLSTSPANYKALSLGYYQAKYGPIPQGP